jgi:hypothetical protein
MKAVWLRDSPSHERTEYTMLTICHSGCRLHIVTGLPNSSTRASKRAACWRSIGQPRFHIMQRSPPRSRSTAAAPSSTAA